MRNLNCTKVFLSLMVMLMASPSFAEDVYKEIIRDVDGNFMVPLLAKRIQCKTKTDPNDKEIFLLKTAPLSITIFNKLHKPTVLFESKTVPLGAFCRSSIAFLGDEDMLRVRCLYDVPWEDNDPKQDKVGDLMLSVLLTHKGKAKPTATVRLSKVIGSQYDIRDWNLSSCSPLH
jgi:hypothetical protein